MPLADKRLLPAAAIAHSQVLWAWPQQQGLGLGGRAALLFPPKVQRAVPCDKAEARLSPQITVCHAQLLRGHHPLPPLLLHPPEAVAQGQQHAASV